MLHWQLAQVKVFAKSDPENKSSAKFPERRKPRSSKNKEHFVLGKLLVQFLALEKLPVYNASFWIISHPKNVYFLEILSGTVVFPGSERIPVMQFCVYMHSSEK